MADGRRGVPSMPPGSEADRMVRHTGNPTYCHPSCKCWTAWTRLSHIQLKIMRLLTFLVESGTLMSIRTDLSSLHDHANVALRLVCLFIITCLTVDTSLHGCFVVATQHVSILGRKFQVLVISTSENMWKYSACL